MMDLEKKVAQLITVGLPNKNLDRQEIATLGRVGFGGVIFFSRNYQDVAQLVELTNGIQKAISPESYQNWPAFISIDQEGGRVERLKGPFTHFPALSTLGEIKSPKTCFEMGFVQAQELRAVGININFSPVLDVHQDQTSEAIGDRSFSNDPELVATLGSALSRGLQKGGVMSVIKHFPGHGAVSVDSHVDLPVCHKSIAELEALDWIPFRRAIKARTEAAMVAHILYPQIDPDHPAGFSRKIVQDILRKELRFSKLVFTDDLNMGAVEKKYSLEEACFLALQAGCDQLLICQSWERAVDIWDHLVKAFDSGALPMVRLEESLERIAASKQKLLKSFKFADKDFAQAMIGNPEFLKISQSIADKQAVEKGPSDKVPE